MLWQNIYRGVVAEHLICRSNGFRVASGHFIRPLYPTLSMSIYHSGRMALPSRSLSLSSSLSVVGEGMCLRTTRRKRRKVPKINKITRGSVIIIKSSENTPEGRATQAGLVVFMRGRSNKGNQVGGRVRCGDSPQRKRNKNGWMKHDGENGGEARRPLLPLPLQTQRNV